MGNLCRRSLSLARVQYLPFHTDPNWIHSSNHDKWLPMLEDNISLSELLGKRYSQRKALGDALVQLGQEYPQLFVLSPDVGSSTNANKFNTAYPDRYTCTGIAEMNTVGIAAGLAYLGFIPVIAGYAIFITGKAWEPFRNSVAYPHLNVKLIGTHAGINVGPDGATHQAIEDLALMRVIPGIEILVPGDAQQVLPALRPCDRSRRPSLHTFGA